MTSVIFKRLAGLLPLFFGITTLSFVVMHLAPGDAVQTQSGFNLKTTDAAREKLRQLYEINKDIQQDTSPIPQDSMSTQEN